MSTNIDERVKSVYQLAKTYPENEKLQEAVEVVKTLRRAQGQLSYWSKQHKVDKKQLKSEIVKLEQDKIVLKQQVTTFSEEKKQLEGQVTLLSHDINSLKSDLATRNAEMVQLTQEKQRIIAQRDNVINELKHIEHEVEMATYRVQNATSWHGKFTAIWTLVQSLFFSDEPKEIGQVDHSLPDYTERPQMRNDPEAIGRDLLDK